jgi:hypothetical protein
MSNVPPKSVSHAFYTELRAGSGLTDETIARAGLYTEHDQVAIHAMLNWPPPKRFAKNSLGDCLVYPCYAPGVSDPYAYILKPTYPRTKKKSNGEARARKYEVPKDGPPLVYFGPRSRDRLRGPDTLIWTEGPKKGLLLEQLGFPMVALNGVYGGHCSATRRESGEFSFHPLIEEHVDIAGRHHVIAFDSDVRSNEQVMTALNVLARMLLDAGALSVKLAPPPHGPSAEKLGIDDYYMLIESRGERGDHAICALFDNAPKMDPAVLDTRPQLVLGTNESRAIDQMTEILATGGSEIFVRHFELVRINRTDGETPKSKIQRALGALTIQKLPRAALRTTLTREASIVVPSDGDGGMQRAHPPTWLVDGLAAAGHWPGMRYLVGISDCPIILADGSLIATSGYHAAAGIYMSLPAELEGLQIDPQPTREECARAAEQLLDLITDSPVESMAGRAAWLAGLLTPFAQAAIEGPTPLFFLLASSPGTGKGKMIQTAAYIATGTDPGMTGYVQDAVEMTKRWASTALAGDRLLVLDDIAGNFGDSATNRALTAYVLSERLLGGNDKPPLPMIATKWASGNNVEIEGDSRRRVIPIRVISKVERPEERSGFKYELPGYVLAHRAKYVRAALTILRGFILAGCPAKGLRTLGSYEDWCRIVAGAVYWATGVDPLVARDVLSASLDPRLEALRAMLIGLQYMTAVEPKKAVRASDILSRLRVSDPDADLAPALAAARNALDLLGNAKPGHAPTARTLGMALTAFVERAVELPDSGGMARLMSRMYLGTHHFWVEIIDAQRAAHGTSGTNGSSTSENRNRGSMHTNDPPEEPGVSRPPSSPKGPMGSPANTNGVRELFDTRRKIGAAE